MTNNQIRLYELVEAQRHNLATEGENVRHNVASENIGYGNIDLGYANVHLGYAQVAEAEGYHSSQVSENFRHNLEVEKIQREQLNYTGEELGIKKITGYSQAYENVAQAQKAQAEKALAEENAKFRGVEALSEAARDVTQAGKNVTGIAGGIMSLGSGENK